jgi:hypothetical protein
MRLAPHLLAAIAMLLFGGPPASAQQVRQFTEAELIDGFVRTVFGAEYEAPADAIVVVKRFTRPVRVYVEPIPSEDFTAAQGRQRKREAEAIIRVLAQRVPGARIQIVRTLRQANVLVVITDARHYLAVGNFMLPGRSAFMRNTVCAGVPAWFPNYAMERALVIVPGDRGNRLFTSCVAEEFLQVLGAVNDDDGLIYSTFNDANDLGGFPLFDQWILNMLYHPRIQPGMREEQVRAVLPGVIREIRVRVEGAAARRVGRSGRAGFATSGLVFD